MFRTSNQGSQLASQLKVKVYMGSTIATYKIESNQKIETTKTLSLTYWQYTYNSVGRNPV